MLAFYSISILHCVTKSTLLAAYVRRGRDADVEDAIAQPTAVLENLIHADPESP